MKRILHISKYYYPFRGGTEQIAQDAVNALKGQYEQKVICFNHEKGNETEIVDDIEVNRCGCFAKVSSQSLSFSYAKTLKKILNDFNPDIIIFHYPNPFVASFLLKYIKDDTKLIVYWHLDIVKQRFLKQLFVDQNKRLIERADKIIATSPNYIEGSAYLSQVKNKCIVVPNCINEDRLTMNEEARAFAEKIRNENAGKTICVAVGRHTKYKGFDYLIKAAKLLDDRFEIFITGKGEETRRLQKEIGDDKKVHLVGAVSDNELKGYLSAMDIFCFPSITKNEAFGVALAEAMYFGKPAITFTIPGSGVNYVSVNGVTGIEVENRNIEEYANAISVLAEDINTRNNYGANAKKRVLDNFMNKDFGDNIKNVIKKVCN